MVIQVPSLVRIKPDALHKTGKYLRQLKFSEIAIIYGDTIKELVGPVLNISFASTEVKVVYEEIITTSDVDLAFKTVKAIPRKTQAIIAIGVGKAIDYAKYCSHILQIPLISAPTVVSNDSFCSPFSSMDIDGKKTTVKTRLPEAVIVDTTIIKTAPSLFIYSGMGDLFCKLSAVFDWKLSYKKTGEPVNDFATTIIKTLKLSSIIIRRY